MQVFDPTRAMNAFTAGAQIGEGIRQRQTQAGLAPLVARGDYQAASQFAGERGDLQSAELYRQQYADQIAQMDERTKAEAAQRADALARIGTGLLKLPYERRKIELENSLPLLQSMGIDADMIGQFDPTDPAINAVISQALPLADLLKVQQPTTLAQGSVLINPITGRRIAENPKEPSLPTGMRMGADGPEWIPGYIEGQQQVRRSGAQNINVSPTFSEKGENKFQEGLGSQAATNYGTIIEQGRAATAAIGNLDTMESLLDSIDYTGFGGDTLLQVQRAGAMLGFEIPDLPAKEAAKRLSSQMALSLKTDLPGPMSNADREFLLSIPPNLNSTAAGNDAILFILRKREERKQDMMQSLLQANPQTMEEMRAWENEYLRTTPPMFTPATQQALLRALSGASQ